VSPERAWEYIAGLSIANDVSARDVQLGRGDHAGRGNIPIGKSFDTFKPLGPALLTADTVDPEQSLTLKTYVDGVLRQHATTAQLIFDFTTLISEISRYTTLEPGDVILTGTPAGVGENTGTFLRPGQTVRVVLEGVGALTNPVRACGTTHT
jgi:2-keto-4-pentenoate hydratase/2-oxohepta-3-ene-1,7-dioic acid hydratase in catechol pathway